MSNSIQSHFNEDQEEHMTKITDENDNLVDVAEDDCIHPYYDWEETPNGHARIAIDLDDDVIKDLVVLWVRDNLDDASQELFFEEVAKSDSQTNPTEALWAAVVNDQLINALRAKIEEVEANADESV